MEEMVDNIKWWWKWNVTHKWYNFRRGVKNLWNYKKTVWSMGDFDYGYLLTMQKFQLERLLTVLEDGYEVDETRIPKTEDIKRCIILLNNKLEDNYAERCGYNSDRTTIGFEPLEKELDGEKLYEMVNINKNPQTEEELKTIFNNARILEDEEWNELWETIKKGNKSSTGMQGWWD